MEEFEENRVCDEDEDVTNELDEAAAAEVEKTKTAHLHLKTCVEYKQRQHKERLAIEAEKSN